MISPLSHIHPSASLGTGVTVDPFAYIGPNVVVGDDCWIGPHATIMEGAFIGNRCKVFPGAVVGAVPQDLKYKGENSTLVVEDDVTIRECCTLNRGTEASMTTRVGKGTLLMAYVHVAHDCFIGQNCILANSVNLAGHIEIGNYVIVGVKAAREPLSYAGVNSVGLKRRGFTDEQISHIQDIYRILFLKGYNVHQAIDLIDAEIKESIEKQQIVAFLRQAERGIMKGYLQ